MSEERLENEEKKINTENEKVNPRINLLYSNCQKIFWFIDNLKNVKKSTPISCKISLCSLNTLLLDINEYL